MLLVLDTLSSHSWKLLFSEGMFLSVPAHQGKLRELSSSSAAGAGRAPLWRTREHRGPFEMGVAMGNCL